MQNPGQKNILKIKPSSFIALDPPRERVPGWHRSSFPWDSKKFMPSRVDGKNGSMQNTLLKRSNLLSDPPPRGMRGGDSMYIRPNRNLGNF